MKNVKNTWTREEKLNVTILIGTVTMLVVVVIYNMIVNGTSNLN
jgi:hypothetical protein